MVYKSVKSKKAFYLCVFAALLMFIQAIVAMYATSSSYLPGVIALFGFLFIVAAVMARMGLGYAGVTQRSVGGGFAVQTVEYADACICGITMGIAVFIFSITSLPFPEGFPGGLAGIVAFLAGLFALRNAMKQGVYGEPRVPVDSKTCKYCGKPGISPQAAACPNCGQPLQ